MGLVGQEGEPDDEISEELSDAHHIKTNIIEWAERQAGGRTIHTLHSNFHNAVVKCFLNSQNENAQVDGEDVEDADE